MSLPPLNKPFCGARSHAGLSRRELALGAAVLAATSASPVSAALSSRPNVVFIMADDLGYADLSCYGRRDYETPNIDRLAAQGLKFEQAYANSAVCSATRVALITGRYQYRLPIGLEEPLQGRDIGLPPEAPTLPAKLKTVGYRTALIGKWHMGALPKYGPLLSGYDHFWGFRGGGLDYFTHQFDPAHPDLWDDDTPVKTEGYLTDLIGDRAISVLEAYSTKADPFFLSLHFNAPHWPWEGPEDEAAAQRIAKSPNPLAIYDFDGGSMKTYGEIVARLDLQVGRVMDALARLGLEHNTIVVFTSDNGGERFSDTWPLNGKKGELLEGGIRVPAIIRWPAEISAGQVSQAVAMTMDWAPTFLKAAGVSASDFETDGIDLSSAWNGVESGERTVFWRFRGLGQEACRSGDLKYLKIAGNTFLFNVKDDPQERANLKRLQPEAYARLTTGFNAWNATMLPEDPAASTYIQPGNLFADRYGNPSHPD